MLTVGDSAICAAAVSGRELDVSSESICTIRCGGCQSFVKRSRSSALASQEQGVLSTPRVQALACVPQTSGKFKVDEQLFLVYEHAGERLDVLLQREPQLRPALFLQAADAIAELLASGIFNCDLKPCHFHAQLLQPETCRIKIIDWDMATMAGELHQHCPLQTNQFLGALPRDTMLGCFLRVSTCLALGPRLLRAVHNILWKWKWMLERSRGHGCWWERPPAWPQRRLHGNAGSAGGRSHTRPGPAQRPRQPSTSSGPIGQCHAGRLYKIYAVMVQGGYVYSIARPSGRAGRPSRSATKPH